MVMGGGSGMAARSARVCGEERTERDAGSVSDEITQTEVARSALVVDFFCDAECEAACRGEWNRRVVGNADRTCGAVAEQCERERHCSVFGFVFGDPRIVRGS